MGNLKTSSAIRNDYPGNKKRKQALKSDEVVVQATANELTDEALETVAGGNVVFHTNDSESGLNPGNNPSITSEKKEAYDILMKLHEQNNKPQVISNSINPNQN